jgi:hypothetical protein
MKITRKSIFILVPVIWGWSLSGCGSAAVERHVLVSTEAGRSPDTPPDDPDKSDEEKTVVEPHSTLEQRMLSDQLIAADILKTVMCDDSDRTAAWAGIYALRLGIKHDPDCARRALLEGTRSDDILVQALSWRYLAHTVEKDLPRLRKGGDPVVRIMAFLAYAGSETIPKDLRGTLALPEGDVRGEDRLAAIQRRTAHLRALAIPFDDGALALAIAFGEAQRDESVEQGTDGQLIWSSARLRSALVTAVLGSETALEELKDANAPGKNTYSTMGERLDNRLVTRPKEMLHNIAMTGPDTLRIEALRAIAVVASSPTAGDFGAAAAAMASPDTRLRVEGARTFLLLFLRLKK